MLVKSLQAGEHVSHIDQTFQTLRRYNMKLNPLKCTFGVASGQFLGYIVNQRGIEANPAKVAAIIEMSSPQKPKEVQSLNGRIAALSRFISRATDKSLPFFKKHLGESPLLSKPHPDESLLLYLAVSDVAVSAVLTREENERQLPVYYISKALLPAETRYSDMEKLALALITASRKLRPYFQAHSIQILTNFPLRQVMQKTDVSGRLLKWAIELSEFDLTFRPRHAIKGQALADFMVEFTKAPEMEALMEPAEPPAWKLFVDGSSGEAGAGRESYWKARKVRKLLASSDSQLVVNQVNGDFAAKDDNMRAYLKLVLDIIPHFEKFKLTQVPRLENAHADALSKLASSVNSKLLNIVPIEHLSKPSTFEGEELLWIEGTPLWMQPIIAYLKEQTLPASRSEARKLRRRAAHFVLQEGTLYKRGFASPLLRCVGGEEATYVLREIHEGICGNHSGGMALAHKKCDKCQRFSNVQRQPAQSLSIVTSPWPFAKWGIDFVGPLPKGRGSATFAIVAIDYFTKWVEAEPLARITEANTTKFVWKNVIYRFGIPHSIVSDNGWQFDNRKMRELCDELGIKKDFSTPHHPQANGQVEAVNKTIKYTLKRKLDASKGAWVDEFPHVLWAIRTTCRTATGETPFSMTYGAEAMSPVEVGVPSHRRIHFTEISNDEARISELHLEEKRDASQMTLAKYHRKMTHFYNSKVRNRTLRLGDLVLKRVFQSSKPTGSGVFSPNWEGPYRIQGESRPGTFEVEDMSGRVLPHKWNIEHLRKYYHSKPDQPGNGFLSSSKGSFERFDRHLLAEQTFPRVFPIDLASDY
ncbi:uncharacterized protein LOC111373911 [Olea europaea var. sylvestris]|uniref:uncharacterized protein LOC111373911 n=1 Tax=Olea europaea var. sylvestris TaxID=158386 RepID=UPI000C1CE09E|nr:uncharacterized protein LOC111373911 [Olea europaea var. sylvestris]